MLTKTRILQIGISVALSVLRPAAACGLDISAGDVTFSKRVKSFKELRSANVIPQTLDYSCGPAALATLLSYYFRDRVTEQEIIKYLILTGNLDKIKAHKGFSLLDLKNYCKYRGYRVTGYQGDLEFFARLKQPVLVPVNIKQYDHFVILRGVKGERVFLADPAMGKMTMLTSQFKQIWKGGVGLVISKKKKRTGPLELGEDEKPVAAGSSGMTGSMSSDALGRVLQEGEF
jgi:predicted double-glycine peptidase